MSLLNKFEYEILMVIQEHPGLNPKGISKYCDQPANIIDCRMTSLIRNLYVEIGYGGDMYGKTYKITAEGLQAMADYKAHKRGIFWFLFEDRFWKAATLSISIAALIVSSLAYSKSQATEQYVKIEIIREIQAPIMGSQSQNVSDSRNSFEKNGIQQKK